MLVAVADHARPPGTCARAPRPRQDGTGHAGAIRRARRAAPRRNPASPDRRRRGRLASDRAAWGAGARSSGTKPSAARFSRYFSVSPRIFSRDGQGGSELYNPGVEEREAGFHAMRQCRRGLPATRECSRAGAGSFRGTTPERTVPTPRRPREACRSSSGTGVPAGERGPHVIGEESPELCGGAPSRPVRVAADRTPRARTRQRTPRRYAIRLALEARQIRIEPAEQERTTARGRVGGAEQAHLELP